MAGGRKLRIIIAVASNRERERERESTLSGLREQRALSVVCIWHFGLNMKRSMFVQRSRGTLQAKRNKIFPHK